MDQSQQPEAQEESWTFNQRAGDRTDDRRVRELLNELEEVMAEQGGLLVGAIQTDEDQALSVHMTGPSGDNVRLLARSQMMFALICATGWIQDEEDQATSAEALKRHIEGAMTHATDDMKDTLASMLEFIDMKGGELDDE
jgi:hypothetical protein